MQKNKRVAEKRFSIYQVLLLKSLVLFLCFFAGLFSSTDAFSASITISAPAAGAIFYKGTNYTITWSSSGITGNVKIHLYKAGQLLLPVSNNELNDGMYSPFNAGSDLLNGTDYQIRMVDINDTASATTGYFTITTAAPSLTSPANGSISASPVPLRWGAVTGNNGYQLQIDNLAPMNITSNQYDAPLQNGAHTWKVCAKDSSGNAGSWSSQWSVNVSTLLAAPSLTSPANGSISASPVPLRWGAVTGNNGYQLQIDNLAPMNITSNQYDAVLQDGIHTWRVCTKNSSGDCGSWSSQWSVNVSILPDTPTLTPLYRSYNSTEKDHYYSINPNEKNGPIGKSGYQFEKIEAYIYNAAQPDSIPLYKVYYASSKLHYYTTDLGNPTPGYTEGPTIVGYVYPNPTESMVPMYHLEHVANSDHFYTISEFERDYATSEYGYLNEGAAFYAARNASASPLAGKPVAKQGGVDLSSGNFVPYQNHVDFANPAGFGIPFVFTRTYNSKNTAQSGPLGPGWNHNFETTITDIPLANFAVVKWGDGRVDLYTRNGAAYTPFPGVYNKLEKTLGSFKITTKDKTVYTFEETVDVVGQSNGRLVNIKDKNGNQMILMYDAVKKGALDHVIDGSNRTYRFHYTKVAPGFSGSNEYRIFEIVEEDAAPLSRRIKFDYDPQGRLWKYTDAENNVTTYAYENAANMGLLTKIILPMGNTITSAYDSAERLSTIKVGIEQTVSKNVQLTYGKTLQTPGGPVEGTEYLVTISNGPDVTISATHENFKLGVMMDGLGQISEILDYDANNNPTHVKDKKGLPWVFSYDQTTGNIKSILNPENELTSYEYDIINNKPNNLLKITDPANNVIHFAYDPADNVKEIINVVGGVDRKTTITREPHGLVETITEPPNNAANISATTTYAYDARGYLATVTDHLGNITTFTYDAGGRLTFQKDADQVPATNTYDNLNRIKTAKDMLDRITSYTYDGNGNLDTVTDPRNILTDYNYNDRDLVETVTEAGVRAGKYGYDEAGRTTKITNAKERSWEMSFDEAGNLKTGKTPKGYIDNFNDYYPDGALKRQVDRNGRETSYAYDGAGRLDAMNITSGRQYSYQYYDNGLIKTILKNGVQAGSFQYDARGNLTTYTDPNSQTITYTYYPGGNLKTITYPGSKVVTYDYDARNLLTSVQDWKGRATGYEYTPGGRLKKITYPNGATIEYIHDASFRLQTVCNKKPDGTIIAQYTVDSFDNLDAPRQITTTGGLAAPVEALNEVYGYDENNRIMTAGNASFTYSPMGEILERTTGAGTDTFVWDSGDVPGRLQTMNVNGTSRTYGYDGLDNRLSATVGGLTTRYVLDLSGSLANVLAETDAGGTVTAHYIYGLGLIGKVLPDAAGTARYYHYDLGGNTVALTDDTGNVTDQYSYDADPYAFDMVKQGSTKNPFTFVGRYGVMDEGNNIFYMRARYYDADSGRFLNEDPIGFAGGDLNLYAYVGGNPVIGIDPTGLSEVSTAKSTPMMVKQNDITVSIKQNKSSPSDQKKNEKKAEKISKGVELTNDFIVSLPGSIPLGAGYFYTLTKEDRNYNGIAPQMQKFAETITNSLAGNKYGQYALEGIAFCEQFNLIKKANDALEKRGVPVEKIEALLNFIK